MTNSQLKRHQDVLREALRHLIISDDEERRKGLHVLAVEIGRLNVIIEDNDPVKKMRELNNA